MDQDNMAALYAVSPLDGRYAEKTRILQEIFSEFALIKYRVSVEIRWLSYLTAEMPEIRVLKENQENPEITKILTEFSPADALRIKEIEKKINHDVKSVEYFIKEKINHTILGEWVHWGCTSSDINNLAYGLMVQTAREKVLLPSMEKIILSLTQIAHDTADQPMLARTHGQKATPTTMGKEFANTISRLKLQQKNLSQIKIYGKINGAVGNFNAHQFVFPDKNWPDLAKKFVESLNLDYQAYTTQIEPHDYIAEILHNLLRINIILIDLCRNIWAYISIDYFRQKTVSEEVGSSTMPHKVNPIDFENAEGNFYLANSIFTCLSEKLPLSRFQRDLVDSTLMRNIGTGLGYSLIAYQSLSKGLNKLVINSDHINSELSRTWEVLAEPIQMTMRAYGVPEAYEKLKVLTRGQEIDQEKMQLLIDQLDLPLEIKNRLKNLTPQTYTGYAAQLAQDI